MTHPRSPINKRVPRKAQANLSDPLERRLLAYAVGAGAAATGLLALSQPAAAEIIYKPAHVSLQSGSTFAIDIAGATEFTLTNKFYIVTGSFSTALLSVTPVAGASVVGHPQQATAMKAGAVIGPSVPFFGGKALLAGAFRETQISSSVVFGKFANTTQRYLGLKIVLYGEVHYGWARFNVVRATAHPPTVKALYTGFAFETRPNEPIKAGQTVSAPSASLLRPESLAAPATAASLQPPSLGLLALGSSGLNAWRREEDLARTN